MRKKYLSCIRFLGFCPLFLPMFGLKATETKVIEVTFDAKDYKSGEHWKGFIEALYKTLAEHPDYKAAEKANENKIFGDVIRFDLTVKNGDILGLEPPPSIFDCFKVTGNNGEVDEDKSNEVRNRIEKMFSKITCLAVFTKHFSLQSLRRFFSDATKVDLWNAEEVKGNFEGLISNLELTVFRCFRLNDGITWSQFIETLCKQLAEKYPDDKRVRFRLEFRNAAIFGTDPGSLDYRDYLDSEKKEPTEITRVLQRIKRLMVDTKQFSMLSLSKVFPWTQELILPYAECIFGAVNEVSLQLGDSDWSAMTAISRSAVPHLHTVQAPNVIRIGNAAFFNFRNLRCFNCKALPTERPTIVCTWLSQNYFTQKKSKENTRIAPVTVKTVVKGGKKKTKFGGKTVKIGACAFQWCTLLQHVSAHASLVGSGAFAASGLKSAHLLLSENADVGDDVFFNCFELKECFMMLGRTDHGTIKSWLNGLFWNCFTLETICMPNVFYPRSNHQIPAKPRDLYSPSLTFKEGSLTMLTNCFSLKHLDLRYFERTYTKILPYWVIQINHGLMEKDKQRWDWKSYRSSAFASKRQVPQSVVPPGTIGNYVKLCNKKGGSHPFGFGVPGRSSYLEKDVYEMPYCDINLITCIQPITPSKLHFKTDMLCTIIETGDFAYTPGASLFPGTLEDMPSAFQRFNDACLQWFVVKEEKPKNVMTGEKPENEIELEEKEEEKKGRKTKQHDVRINSSGKKEESNGYTGKKTKRSNF